jgi:hypothetical protein
MPPPEQGLGMLEPKRPRIPSLGIDPHDAPKALSNLKMISDRLSERADEFQQRNSFL